MPNMNIIQSLNSALDNMLERTQQLAMLLVRRDHTTLFIPLKRQG